MNVRDLAARQYDVVAAWQLVEAGWSRAKIHHQVSECGWRGIHRGVFVLSNAALTRHQLWMAATLTAPESVLSHASAAACWGFRPWQGGFETIARAGSGGPKRIGAVLVMRSTSLAGDLTSHQRIPITTAARVLIDLAPHLDDRATGRAFREAIRLKTTTAKDVQEALDRHPNRRGTNLLRHLASRYANIPYEKTRSDAEGRALELLRDSRSEPPDVNEEIAGEEADLSWPERRTIIEIDGPQYHRFPDEDARKQARWEAAGYRVIRVPSDAVYDEN